MASANACSNKSKTARALIEQARRWLQAPVPMDTHSRLRLLHQLYREPRDELVQSHQLQLPIELALDRECDKP